MSSLVRYLILSILVAGILAVLLLTVNAPLIYSLEQDTFLSRYHDNTDVLKLQQLNSTTDLLPLMQDLLDFTGPIVLNINLKDMDQVRRDLALFAKYHRNLDNLIIRIDMTESEIEAFSKSSETQRLLLEELMKASISLDDLKMLEIQYRDENNPTMLVSVLMQQDAIRKKLRELYGQYERETQKIEEISKKYNLDITKEEESLKEFKKIVELEGKTAQNIESSQSPTLSLLLIPETGQYLDTIDFTGMYYGGNTFRNNYPVVLFVDNIPYAQVTAGGDGIYHSAFLIEHIPAGLHEIFATSGTMNSGIRILDIESIESTTSLSVTRVKNKPDLHISGVVYANKPVRNAPVEIITDDSNILQLTTNINGRYQTNLTFEPGIHRIQAQFVNTTYPIFPSKSQIYEIEASRDASPVIRLLNTTMSADEFNLSVTPTTGMYKDVIRFTGILAEKDPEQKKIDIFIDDTYYRSVQTETDGSFVESYTIEKIKTGNHTVFVRYTDQVALRDIYSEPRQFRVDTADSVTLLSTEMTDGGTGLICKGNVTANAHGVSSVPLELVWDDQNIISTRTDETGSFRQIVSLPVGNHSIYARFISNDYPINPSRSKTTRVTILPPIDLFVKPLSVHYLDALDIEGSLNTQVAANKNVQIILDNQNLIMLKTDMYGNFSTRYTVDQMPAGEHTVQASSGDFTSEMRKFRILSVNSSITLIASPIPASSRVACSGNLVADTQAVRSAPVLLIWDDQNIVETVTNRYGYFEEILTLPQGKHSIQAIFNHTSQFPINPSASAVVEVEIPRMTIPGNLTIRITPDQVRFGDTLNIAGTLSAEKNVNEEVQIYIDRKKLDAERTDNNGNFTLKYPVDRITEGVHSVNAVSGNFRSGSISFLVVPANSQTALTVKQVPGTAHVVCSGNIRAENRSVSFAPVTLSWDNRTVIKTNTDKSGNFSETIILPAGMHQIQAQFNSTDIFPIYPSKSTLVEINISPALSLGVSPTKVIYKDRLTLEGTLIRPDSLEDTIDIFLDNNLITSTKTDRTGRYTYWLAIEQIPAGQHKVQARSGDLSSGVSLFQVLPVHSRTSLIINKINNSALIECNGSVMAFDHAGDIIRKPGSISEVLAIIATLGKNPLDAAKRPVSFAPVSIVVNNRTLFDTQTDKTGEFAVLISLPTGDSEVTALFVNGSYPLLSSQSKGIAVNNLSVNIAPVADSRSSTSEILAPVMVALILLLFIGGSIFYLKRRSIFIRRKQTPADQDIGPDTMVSPDTILSEIAREDSFLPSVSPPEQGLLSTDPILARYVRILNAQGLSTAARAVYVHFTGNIAQKLHIRRHQTLTPREFLYSCKERPFESVFASFVAIYEEIRYGGAKSPDKEEKFEESVKSTDKSLGDGNH